MEVEKEKTAEEAKDVSPKVNVKSAMKLTDNFMTWVFKFGKVISALVVLVCVATMVCTLLYYVFKGSGSIDSPDFDDMKSEMEEKASDSGNSVQNAEYKELRKEFGSKVDDLIEIGCLDAKNDYERIINRLANLDEDLRSAYIKGAISFMKDAKSYFASKFKDKKFSGKEGGDVLEMYNGAFKDAKKAAEEKKVESAAKRSAALSICGMAFMGVVLFLIIPLLLQIEENTRK